LKLHVKSSDSLIDAVVLEIRFFSIVGKSDGSTALLLPVGADHLAFSDVFGANSLALSNGVVEVVHELQSHALNSSTAYFCLALL